MKTTLSTLIGLAGILFSCMSADADLIQVGRGGNTDPLGSPAQIDVVLDTGAFTAAGLWDAGSSTVGGGTVAGDLYYAFIARPLDREGGASYIPNPPGAVGGLPTPSNSRGGGLITRGATEVLGVGDNASAYAYSTFGALTGNADLSNRLDLSPNLAVTFLVHVQYNASGNDSVTVTGTIPYHGTTHTRSATGDVSFDAFSFMSDTSTGTNNRWVFSNVAFATTADEALDAMVPEPSTWALLVIGSLTLAGIRLLRRKR